MKHSNKTQHNNGHQHWKSLLPKQPKGMFALGTRAVLKEKQK